MSTLTTTLVTLASEAEGEGHSLVPYAVGAGTLLFLLALMAALIVFGGGREHS